MHLSGKEEKKKKQSEKNPLTLGHSHSFDVSVAEHCGLEAAAVFNHIVYWLKANKAKDKNFHEGKTWMYDTYDAMASYLTYLTARQIQYAIMKLVDQGLLVKEKIRKNRNDHTNWYAIGDESLLGYSKKSYQENPKEQICTIDQTNLHDREQNCSIDRTNLHHQDRTNLHHLHNTHIEEHKDNSQNACARERDFSSFFRPLEVINGFPIERTTVPVHSCRFPFTFIRPDGTRSFVPEDGELPPEVLQSAEYLKYCDKYGAFFPRGVPTRLPPCQIHKQRKDCDVNCIVKGIAELERQFINPTTTTSDNTTYEDDLNSPENKTQGTVRLNASGQIVSVQKKKIKPSEPLVKHGSHVQLSEASYQKLCDEMTKPVVDGLIEDVNNYCDMHGKNYKDYAAAVRAYHKKKVAQGGFGLNKKDVLPAKDNEEIATVNRQDGLNCVAHYRVYAKQKGRYLNIQDHVNYLEIINDKIYYDLPRDKFKEMLRHCIKKYDLT